MKLKMMRKLKFLAIVTVSMILTACGEVDLYSNLSEREANEMMSVLYQGQIEVIKEAQADGLFVVKVAKEDLRTATAVLLNHGLPRESRKNCEQMYEGKGGLLPAGPREQSARDACNQKMSIEETLSQMAGVIIARVLLVLPVRDSLTEVPEEASASVYLKTRYDYEIDDRMGIKKVVTDAVPGLNYRNVSLKIERSESMLDQAKDLDAINGDRLDPKNASTDGRSIGRLLPVSGALLLIFTAFVAFLYRRGRLEQEAMNHYMEYEESHDEDDQTRDLTLGVDGYSSHGDGKKLTTN